jgi:hypothetical protein
MLMMMQLYVSFVRRQQEKGNYKSWDKYSWDDYVSRSALSKTFYARYVPQRGTFGDLLPDPECWNNPPDVPPPSGPTTDVSVLESIAATAATVMTEWDSDKDEWVASTSKA